MKNPIGVPTSANGDYIYLRWAIMRTTQGNDNGPWKEAYQTKRGHVFSCTVDPATGHRGSWKQLPDWPEWNEAFRTIPYEGVVTYQSPRGCKVNLSSRQEAALHQVGTWPRDWHNGEEMCQVYMGKHPGEPVDDRFLAQHHLPEDKRSAFLAALK